MFALRVALVLVVLVMISVNISTPSLVMGRGVKTHADHRDDIHLAHVRSLKVKQQGVKQQQQKPKAIGQQQQQIANPASVMIPAERPPNIMIRDQQHYVTLFDKVRNIPYYTAYVITATEAAKIGTYDSGGTWEKDIDQLVNAADVYSHNNRKYTLDRGHMNPSYINTFDKDRMQATYKLTNAAPLYDALNSGRWETYEKKLAKYAKDVCAQEGGTLYAYTGTSFKYVPGKKPKQIGLTEMEEPPQIKIAKVDRTEFMKKLEEHNLESNTEPTKFPEIAIPSSVYTAACCFSPNGFVKSMAMIINNHPDMEEQHQTETSVPFLSSYLNVQMFPNEPLKKCNSEDVATFLSIKIGP